MRKIFTMIELLIVISIIAVLAAMLLPALGKARDRAMAIKCVSNLKNIHLMAVSYLNDNNGRYPYTVLSNIGEPVSTQVCTFAMYSWSLVGAGATMYTL